VPVLVGSAVAARTGAFRAVPALAALTGALLIQIGTNLLNDVDDFERGADTAARRGPTRVTQSGLIAPAQVRSAAWSAFAGAALVGLYLATCAGWPIALLGAAALVAGWAYTGGPWPLGYHGLGEACVFAFFGIAAVTGTAYVQTRTLDPLALAAALPVGALVSAILVVNNARDVDTDRVAGKRTLAVRFGPTAARAEYVALLGVAYVVPALLCTASGVSALVLAPWLTLPSAYSLAGRPRRATDGGAFNGVLRDTARLHLWFGALLALGFVR
jgi:1,4-dihydroxy-2-naphthoate polyprenyltransferase